MSDKIPGDVEGMEASMERLLALIDDAYKYVDDVVLSGAIRNEHPIISLANMLIHVLVYSPPQENRVAPDNSVGRFIADAVSSLPKMSPAAFDKLVNDSLQVRILKLDHPSTLLIRSSMKVQLK